MVDASVGTDETRRRNLARLLNRRYLLAMAGLVSLLLLDQFLVQPFLVQLMIDAPTINVAGRQRMFSQRIVKAALASDRAVDRDERARHLAEMTRIAALWSDAHDSLRKTLRSRSSQGGSDDPLVSIFKTIEPTFARMQEAVSRFLHSASGPDPDLDASRISLKSIQETEDVYLDRMEEFVGRYEKETRARVNGLLWTGWLLTGLIVAVLIGIGLFILRPATRIIERQFRDINQAYDEMEERVRERTRSLEEANLRLEREVAERSLVESRNLALVEMFSHASRINTLGEMASSLAHELNQPLGAIANYSEGCLVELNSPQPAYDEVQNALGKIVSTTLRAGRIIDRVRRFVTRRPLEREPFSANPLVLEVTDLLRAEADRRGIVLEIHPAPDLPCLLGAPAQIQQVLINLVRNAFEAIPDSELEFRKVVIETRGADSCGVEFRIIDQGEGIPLDRIDRVFDAYFSTRAEGMGMGLAISRTIIEAHQGKLSVESELGVGTTFRFLLPTTGPKDDA